MRGGRQPNTGADKSIGEEHVEDRGSGAPEDQHPSERECHRQKPSQQCGPTPNRRIMRAAGDRGEDHQDAERQLITAGLQGAVAENVLSELLTDEERTDEAAESDRAGHRSDPERGVALAACRSTACGRGARR